MKTRTLRSYATVLLALAALFPVGRICAREWIKSSYWAGVGTVEGEPAEMSVHVNAHVADDGTANGTVQFRVLGGESFLYRAVGGEAIVEEGTVVELFLTLERVGEDGAPTGETDQLIVRRSSAQEDSLIYTTLGTDVTVEAEGTIGLRHEHIRP